MNNKINANKFYWTISAVFLVVLLFLAFAYTFITLEGSEKFYLETRQKLYKDVAAQVLEEVHPFTNAEVNVEGMKKIMAHHMKVNPSAEVYLLDTNGKVLMYDAKPNEIKTPVVHTSYIKEFIAAKGELFIIGDNPKGYCSKTREAIFSAAPVYQNNQLRGYVYVILAGLGYNDYSEFIYNSFFVQVGIESFIITLVFSLVIGLLVIWYLTKNLRVISEEVNHFAEGDFSTRIQLNSKGELSKLASTINEMADTISKNIEQIRSVEKLRKELVANVSHDLRTPIAVVRGYVETLLMKEQNLSEEEKAKYIHAILASTQKLEKLVSDLFELTRLESDQISLHKEVINFSELVNAQKQKFDLLAQQKKINFSVKANDCVYVVVDVAMMDRVLQNLIDNAIKYTPEQGNVAVKVELIEAEKVRFSVSDSGIGIADDQLAFVFDRYKKVDGNENTSGQGLGLAIVKRVLDLHKVVVHLVSEKGKGSTFSFELPIEKN